MKNKLTRLFVYDNSTEINKFDPIEICFTLSSLFGKQDQESRKSLALQILDFIKDFPMSPDEQEVKEMKEMFKAERLKIARREKSSIPEINAISKECCLSEAAYINLLHSLLRFPEFYLYSEEECNLMSKNIHLYKEKINAITYEKDGLRICPYKGELKETLEDDIDNQYENCIEFAKRKDVAVYNKWIESNINKEKIKDCLNQIELWVLKDDPNMPKRYLPAIKAWRKCHKLYYKMDIDSKIEKISKIGFDTEDLSLATSRSVVNDHKGVKDLFVRLGWTGTIPNVLQNLVHFQYVYEDSHGNEIVLPIALTEGQIDLSEINLGYVEANFGLGPAMKLRVVFNTSVEIQQFANIYVDVVSAAHEGCINHAYKGQMDQLKLIYPEIVDAFDTDYTGYSDYLNRNVYKWIAEHLYHWPEAAVKNIDAIMNLPLKLGEELIKAKYGTWQGLKLVVYIMNDANLLIGIITDMLKRSQVGFDLRQNCGDDEYECSFTDHFTASDINVAMFVALIFNCPTNKDKTEWLKRDNMFTFCSVSFGRDSNGKMISMSGLPPKLYAKQKACIRDIAELYRVADRNCLIEHINTIEDFIKFNENYWKKLCERGYEHLGLALKPVKDKKDINYENDLETRWEIAKTLSYNIGGLAMKTENDAYALEHMFRFADKLYCNYSFKPGKIYNFALNLIDLGLDGKMIKFFANVTRKGMKSYFDLVKDIGAVQDEYNDTGAVDEDKVRKIIGQLNMYSRAVIDGKEFGTSGSTYHRVMIARDGDIGLTGQDIDITQPLVYRAPRDIRDLVSLARLIKDPKYDELTAIHKWLIMSNGVLDMITKGMIRDERRYGFINGSFRFFYPGDEIKMPDGRSVQVKVRLYNANDTSWSGGANYRIYTIDEFLKYFPNHPYRFFVKTYKELFIDTDEENSRIEDIMKNKVKEIAKNAAHTIKDQLRAIRLKQEVINGCRILGVDTIKDLARLLSESGLL